MFPYGAAQREAALGAEGFPHNGLIGLCEDRLQSAPPMNDLNSNPNSNSQSKALTRFRALSFVEDQVRCGHRLSEALHQASLQPWPDENGDYYARRTLEDWWYAYKKGGFKALQPRPRSDQGQNRVLDETSARWIIEQVTQSPLIVVHGEHLI